jgi:hypothetical protein
MKEYKEGLGKFSSHTRFEVGHGSTVSFWHDLWCGDKALKEGFLMLWYCLWEGCFHSGSLEKFLAAPINGTSALLVQFMIERWISLPRSTICCIQLE